MREVKGYQLRACPYCGKDVADFATAKEEEECKWFDDDERCDAYAYNGCPCKKIVCNAQKGGCGASTGYSWSEEDAVERWNRRVGE